MSRFFKNSKLVDSDNSDHEPEHQLNDDDDELQMTDSSENSESEDEDDQEKQMEQIKNSLAMVPFEKLQELKKRGDLPTQKTAKHLDKETQQPTKKGKNQPMEVSSRRRPSKLMDLGTAPKNPHNKKFRDPRFDSLSGKLNEEMFHTNYRFVKNYKETEIKKLTHELKREKDPQRKEEIQRALSGLQREVGSMKNQEQERQKKKERRKAERELVLQGKNPFYTKKSDERTMELLHKFTELKKKGQLDKYLVKKKRKQANKEHKHIPWKRKTAAGPADDSTNHSRRR